MTQSFPLTLHVPVLKKPERLDKFLIRRFPKTSRNYWRDHLVSSVLVDGKKCRKGQLLKGSESIEITRPPFSNRSVPQPEAALQLRVLYRDRHLLAVDKPAGVPCYPLRESETATVANAATALFPELGEFSENPLEAGLLHRLDNETSGVLLFCRSPKSLKRFQQLNRSGEIAKYYLAVVHGLARARETVSFPIGHHPKSKKKMRIAKNSAETAALAARPAKTEYRRVKTGTGFSLLLVRISKGLRHQIRIHLAQVGHPIVGDKLYGKRSSAAVPVQRHLLHARKIELRHPFLKKALAITSPLPADFQRILNKYF